MRSTKEQAPRAKGVRRNQLLGIFSADGNHQKENRINQIKLTHAIRFYVIWTQIISTGWETHSTYRGSLQSDQLKVTGICVYRRACVTCYSSKHLCQQKLASKQLLTGGLTEPGAQTAHTWTENTNKMNNCVLRITIIKIKINIIKDIDNK